MLLDFVIRETPEAREARRARLEIAPPRPAAVAAPETPATPAPPPVPAAPRPAPRPARSARPRKPLQPARALSAAGNAAPAAKAAKSAKPAKRTDAAPLGGDTAPFADAFAALCADVATTRAYESLLRGQPPPAAGTKRPAEKDAEPEADPETVLEDAQPREVAPVLGAALDAAIASRKRARAAAPPDDDLSDDALSQYARFTQEIALAPYTPFLHYVPRLVNVVTLAEALPVPGAGISLPLDLKRIASRCTGAFYAPRRFAAVQLAYANPRCRVLVFHTGRLVGTGTSGAMAARLAILRAQRQLSEEADVHLKIRSFQIINQVGAASLRATLNCDAFAGAHSGTSHFDRASFVGLAWRPPNESICCEIYSTGRANLPGSVAERQLLGSFARMIPELLRFSSASALLAKIPEAQQAHHRPSTGTSAADADAADENSAPRAARRNAPVDLWADWGDAVSAAPEEPGTSAAHAALDDAALAALGM